MDTTPRPSMPVDDIRPSDGAGQSADLVIKPGELSVRISYYLFQQVPGQELDDLRRWTATVRPGDGDECLCCAGARETLVWSGLEYQNFREPRTELAARAWDEVDAGVGLLLDRGWGFRLHATD
jgi:predicted amidohydrolase YtcJ